MAQWAIVAIPEKDDYVWKLSSEKIPHMTLLYLGEQEAGPELAQITSYIEHAVETMCTTFGMSVDRRGTLGPKEADVLFFDKKYCEWFIGDFRDSLLKEQHILEMYNSNLVNYPEWIPHLTLGFPETPAHEDTRDYPGVHWVNFNKIALWTGDFEGPEWELNTHNNMLEVGHADMAVSTKPWGDYKESDYTLEQWHRACLIHQHTGTPTSKAQCKLPVRTPDGTVNKNGVVAAAGALAGARAELKATDEQKTKAKKALIRFYNQLEMDKPDSLEQSNIHRGVSLDQKVNPDDLKQHGVKGMRWGVRKDDTIGVSNLQTQGSRVVTVPSKKDAAPGSLTSQNNVATTTHNIAKQLSTSANSAKMWNDVRNEIIAKVGSDDEKIALNAKNLPIVNEIVARRLTAEANRYTKRGTSARVMATHSLNKKLNPSQNPMLHLIVGKNKADVDAYVANVRISIKAGKNPKNDWIVHADSSDVEVLELTPIVDSSGFIVGIKEPDVQHSHISGISLDQKVKKKDLLQFGVLGMRWGVRRARGADGRVHGKVISDESRAAMEIQRRLKKGGTAALSNEELRRLTDRINLETNLVNASINRKTTLDSIKSKARKGLDLGKLANEAINFATSPAGQLIVDAVGGKHKGLKPHEALRLAKFGRDEEGNIGSLHRGGKKKKNK